MGLTIVQVDAFTSTPYAGNPAAVCVLPMARDERWMQDVAREMNLSETAFLLAEDDGYRLRWFTPAVEVALCGHATLASAHVLPQDVRASERGVTAQRHLDGGGEPAQPVAVIFGKQKRRFGEIHLPGDVLHPALVARRREHAHRRRVAGVRLARERVYLDDREAHALQISRLPSRRSTGIGPVGTSSSRERSCSRAR